MAAFYLFPVYNVSEDKCVMKTSARKLNTSEEKRWRLLNLPIVLSERKPLQRLLKVQRSY